MIRLTVAGKTDTGLQREHNEDAFLVLPEFAVMVVADGLGGHRSGQVASQLAVSTVEDFFSVTVRDDATWPFPVNEQMTSEENYLFTGIRLANRRIFDRSLKTMNDFGMGTTCVAAMLSRDKKRMSVAHVGDSRCYRIRDGKIVQITRDHSLVSDAMHMAPWMSDEEIAQLPPNMITRALGIREDVVVDLTAEEARPGDLFLLCSDGLSSVVEGPEICEIALSTRDLDEASALLIDKANAYGGPDNITVVLGRVEDADSDPPKPANEGTPSGDGKGTGKGED